MTAGSEYVWNVVGGQILSTQNNEVVVVWTSTEGVLTVRELNSNGCKGVEVVKPLVRAEQLEELSFTVFPNPAADVITLNIEREEAFIQIMDVMGRVQMNARVLYGSNIIDISNLAYGTYKVVLMSEGDPAIETLVIGK